jgi:hypothetical protein
MPPLRFGLCFCLALVGVAGTPVSGYGEPTLRPDSRAPRNQATVILVGAAGRDSDLKALLGELLERRGVRTSLSEQDAFGREELLHAEARGSGVLVFVVPSPDGNVRLYFRAPDGERFLLRSVLLRSGFDDVGRELLGQVVETAVGTLLDSGEGLTREQAQLALTSEDRSTTRSVQDDNARPAVDPPRRAAWRTPPPFPRLGAPAALEAWLALRYGVVALGNGLGVAHGPGIELGLGVRRHFLLRGRLLGERDFPHSFSTPSVAAELTRTRLRLATDAGFELNRRHWLLISLGIGQDRVDVRPTAPPGSRLAPEPSFHDQAPVALAELRYEAALGRFRVGAALGADLSLVRTHYDVVHGAERESVGKPWLIRPSAALSLAFCPALGRF